MLCIIRFFMKVTNGINIFAASIFLPILLLGVFNISGINGIFYSPVSYAVISLVIFLLGVAILYYSIRGFLADGSLRLLLIGIGIFIGAVFIFIHTFFPDARFGFAYEDGDFNTHFSWFLSLATLMMSVFLFLTVGLKERSVVIKRRLGILVINTLIVLVVLICSWFVVSTATEMGIVVSATAVRWTPLGRFLQAGTIMLLAVSAIRYLHGAFLIRSEVALAFATGIVLLVMSELTFAGVQVLFDPFFWAAHIWLLMSMLSFLWGSYVSQKTHVHGTAISDTGVIK
ncbi:MAG: hypothetical protein UT32_C0024G0008 [Parcubacteria group bacterium GW2011_GWC2_39_14]|nr:MAG: hypothetical protein UT32_C0024G0008 [Parcubacteria group bacterium GW2011_GWC2_39_14]